MGNDLQVLEANTRFYEAFNRSDLDLMKQVWHHDESVVCLHPGWEVLKGFKSILKSWTDIFQNSQGLEIRLSHVEVVDSENLVWVGCRENLFSMSMSGVQVSKVHATNLFQRFDGQWKMVLHHASSIPGRAPEEHLSFN